MEYSVGPRSGRASTRKDSLMTTRRTTTRKQRKAQIPILFTHNDVFLGRKGQAREARQEEEERNHNIVDEGARTGSARLLLKCDLDGHGPFDRTLVRNEIPIFSMPNSRA